MLNRIFRDVDGTGIVTVDGKMLLTNTVIKEFLHPQKLGAMASGRMYSASTVDNEINSTFCSSRRQDYYPHKNNLLMYYFYHQHSNPSLR